MASKSNHVHKLKRLRYKSGNVIFFCCLPDCTYKTNIQLALGKRSICHRCGNDFLMSEYSLRLAKPHCDACHQPKNQLIEVGPGILQDSTLLESMHPQFPPNRELKQGEIPAELTLAERIQRTIHKTLTIEEEEL